MDGYCKASFEQCFSISFIIRPLNNHLIDHIDQNIDLFILKSRPNNQDQIGLTFFLFHDWWKNCWEIKYQSYIVLFLWIKLNTVFPVASLHLRTQLIHLPKATKLNLSAGRKRSGNHWSSHRWLLKHAWRADEHSGCVSTSLEEPSKNILWLPQHHWLFCPVAFIACRKKAWTLDTQLKTSELQTNWPALSS